MSGQCQCPVTPTACAGGTAPIGTIVVGASLYGICDQTNFFNNDIHQVQIPAGTTQEDALTFCAWQCSDYPGCVSSVSEFYDNTPGAPDGGYYCFLKSSYAVAVANPQNRAVFLMPC
jgi:hypothetical protein